MLDRDVEHILIIAMALDSDDLGPIGDGCSIGVVDLFIDRLPPYTPPTRWLTPVAGYEAMTAAYSLDEE